MNAIGMLFCYIAYHESLEDQFASIGENLAETMAVSLDEDDVIK